MDFHTLAARGGRDVPSASRPLTPPIYQTNVYVFEDMDTVESVWESKKPGFVYGRYGTGNHAMLEDLVAALEGAEAAVACASGMGATTALLAGHAILQHQLQARPADLALLKSAGTRRSITSSGRYSRNRSWARSVHSEYAPVRPNALMSCDDLLLSEQAACKLEGMSLRFDEIDAIVAWLIDGAPGCDGGEQLVSQLCERLVAAGLPLARLRL